MALLSCSHKQPQIQDCDHDTRTFRCVTYVKNYDGDTVTFNISNVHSLLGNSISVRVRGIDTPEMKGKSPCEKERARKAQRLVEGILRGAKRIELTNIERGKYFRILANVIADGESIDKILIEHRLAVPYDGGTKRSVDWCKSPPQ